MKLKPEGPPTLPLWIDGRALVTMTEEYQNISRCSDHRIVRRTPVCRCDEISAAAHSAQQAALSWVCYTPKERITQIENWWQLVIEFEQHLTQLFHSEANTECHADWPLKISLNEVTRENVLAPAAAIIGNATAPISSWLYPSLTALIAGQSVVIVPMAGKSVAYAMAELTAQAGWLPGVWNILFGDQHSVVLLQHALQEVQSV